MGLVRAPGAVGWHEGSREAECSHPPRERSRPFFMPVYRFRDGRSEQVGMLRPIPEMFLPLRLRQVAPSLGARSLYPGISLARPQPHGVGVSSGGDGLAVGLNATPETGRVWWG